MRNTEANQTSLNGSVDLLANAMRQVFTEAMQQAVEPVRKDMENMETRLNKSMSNMEDRLDKRMDGLKDDFTKQIDTTNENMQAQFAEQQKKIGRLLSEQR